MSNIQFIQCLLEELWEVGIHLLKDKFLVVIELHMAKRWEMLSDLINHIPILLSFLIIIQPFIIHIKILELRKILISQEHIQQISPK
jgi:hypothetical protein